MKILITGAAGFIGYHVCKKLLELGHTVVGIDNLNDYYDVNLKLDRLKQLGIKSDSAVQFYSPTNNTTSKAFKFVRMAIEDREMLPKLFKNEGFDIVCNLAAQAGVRYSLENPESYVDSNIVGFLNVLECCRNNAIKHLVYASSSSVYGMNKKVPFETGDNVDHPISLYAASKKSNELMAHTYSHLFGLKTTGLRFFTVYGPWGRPDMAMFLFTKAILENKPIKVFNAGRMERDFTYIDDIVQGVVRIIQNKRTRHNDSDKNYKLYNIGNSNTVKLLDFVTTLEKKLGITAKKEMLPMQPGDVERTWADVTPLKKDFNYAPDTSVTKGVSEFVDWYRDYYNI